MATDASRENHKGASSARPSCRRLSARRGRPLRRYAAATLALSAGAIGALPALARAAPASATAPATQAQLPPSDYAAKPVCGAPPVPGVASCLALQLLPLSAAARAHTHPLGAPAPRASGATRGAGAAAGGRYGLRPQDLATAYHLPTGVASGQTIAIVDAYDDPSVEADLATYDAEFGLPPCTSSDGCFRKLDQQGKSAPLPSVEGEWTMEIALDVETSHAICERCHILLVEADSPSYSDLEAAEQLAAAAGATEISNSWGGEEPLGDSEAFNHPSIAITAASGDFGYRNWDGAQGLTGFTDYPASSPHVVAVGGTRLALSAAGAWAGERVWNGDGATGGGCSERFPAPPWQRTLANWSSVGCGSTRAVADVAADADPYTGAAIYDSTPVRSGESAPGWLTLGGTSLASPIIAATYALAGGVHSATGYGAQAIYEGARAARGSLHAVDSGSNGECRKPLSVEGTAGCTPAEEAASCGGHAICLASAGYNGPAGVGTPDGICAFEPPEACVPQSTGAETTGGGLPPSAPTGHGAPIGGQPLGLSDLTAGSTAGDVGSGSTSPGSSAAPLGGKVQASIARLSLTLRTRAALRRAHKRRGELGVARSDIVFSYMISSAERVSVRIARLARQGGRGRWRTVGPTLAISARSGHNRGRLRGAALLAPGRYRLTLVPSSGRPCALVFEVG